MKINMKYSTDLYIETKGTGNGGSIGVYDLNMAVDKDFWKRPLST
jgi:hypothetical protein